MARPKVIRIGNGESMEVSVIVKEGKLEGFKAPKSTLEKKRVKVEKKPPPPKSAVIPSLTKPLPPVLIVKENATPAALCYHNSHHGLMRSLHTTRQQPLKRNQYRLGNKPRPYSSHFHRPKELPELMDR